MAQNLAEAMAKKEDKKTLPEPKKDSSIKYDPRARLNMLWFCADGIGLPICKKLVDEGNNIIIGQVQDLKDIDGDSKEDPEVKRRRLSLYDGILKKRDAFDVLKDMESLNPKDWIVFFDFNNMGPLAERALEMGFTRGLFPTTEDTALEKDRNSAKSIVEKHYPDMTIAEVHEFSTADEGIQFLEDTDKMYVLKGNGDGDGAKTIVPQGEDSQKAKQIIIDALQAHSADYEDGGFILEEKIIEGWELTPQAVFLDGELIFTDIDIENKCIGSGNNSVQTGAMQTLVVKTKNDEKINKIAFPKWVHDQAKKHVGLFIVDAGIIVKDGKNYFTEFCFQRFGWDSIFAEIAMAGSATNMFEAIFNGNNPLKKEFGVAIRALNMHKDGKERRVLEGVSMNIGDESNTWPYECKYEEDKYVCTGISWDMVVFSGAWNSVKEAADEAYQALEEFAFEDLYYRPKFDFLSFEYQSSIPSRFTELNHKMFEARDMERGPEDIGKRIQVLDNKMSEVLKNYAK